MSLGDRAALEGILASLRPSLSIEIGSGKGGSLERISHHSAAVHAFDVVRLPELTADRFPNVTFHFGDSHELLAPLLAELAGSGHNVDFAFVDGDHSAEGAQRDLEDLLESPAVARSVILVHDTLNQRVRLGLERASLGTVEKVRYVDLDFVQGSALRGGERANELWGGIGLVVVGWDVDFEPIRIPTYGAPEVYAAFSQALADEAGVDPLSAPALRELEEEVETLQEVVRLVEGSWSWRLTAPLRRARRLARLVGAGR
jgi:methyltransferase family protein